MPGIAPASEVLSVVLAAWIAGTAALGTATRFGGDVGAGHFKVVWLVCAGLSAGLGFWEHVAWAVAALCLATFAAIYLGWDGPAGIVASAAALGVLIVQPFTSAAGLGVALCGALLLGAVTNAMLLGHWHLNQPGLGTGPLRRLVFALWAGLAAYTVSVVVLAAISAGAAVVGAVTAAAFTVFAAVLTGMVTHLVRTRSIMSATGILYLEILLCFVAVFTGALGALATG